MVEDKLYRLKPLHRILPMSDSRKGCPYKVYVNKFMQNSGAEIICSYTIVLICNIATAVYCRHLRLQISI